jgi:hypothetical protein
MKDYYARLRQLFVHEGSQFNQVEILSYHLPKTAGTAFYMVLEHAFGQAHIRRIYDQEERLPLNAGMPRWSYPGIKVLHGHFRPHVNHIHQYPKAKRIVWLRDPIERCWSLLNHWLRVENGPIYARFKEKHRKDLDTPATELFDRLAKDVEFAQTTHFYVDFFQGQDKTFFHFIGNQAHFTTEIQRLADFLNMELSTFETNTNPIGRKLPFNKAQYLPYFESEYAFLQHKFDIDFR